MGDNGKTVIADAAQALEAMKYEPTVDVSSPALVPSDVPTLQSMLTAERMMREQAQKEVEALKEKTKHSVQMIEAYQPYIPGPPGRGKEDLFKQACANDAVTSVSWRDKWLKHLANNVVEFDADAHTVGEYFGKHAFGPAIIAGSGPSLKKNVDVLAGTPKGIPIVSCLHNFAFFVDNNVPCEYFVTLDAGDVVVPEMYQGGTQSEEAYQKASEGKTLIAGLVSPPELIRNWKGKVVWFNATIPDDEYMEKMKGLTKSKWVYSVGGNTLGACFYHAAYIFGCNPVAMVGADFSFDYMQKFHSWDSPYDAQFSGLIPVTNVFGHRVHTWVSYFNFKNWFEFQSMGGQGQCHGKQIINCTEGGILGSYPEGNIQSIKQLRLFDFLDGYTRHEKLGEVLSTLEDGQYTVMC